MLSLIEQLKQVKAERVQLQSADSEGADPVAEECRSALDTCELQLLNQLRAFQGKAPLERVTDEGFLGLFPHTVLREVRAGVEELDGDDTPVEAADEDELSPEEWREAARNTLEAYPEPAPERMDDEAVGIRQQRFEAQKLLDELDEAVERTPARAKRKRARRKKAA